MHSLSPQFPFALCAIFLLNVGCASLTGNIPVAERYTACPQDSVWEGALLALQHYPMTEKDKEKGILETGWREQPVKGSPYGLFGREALGNKERSQFTLTLKPVNPDVVLVKLAERRQHWGFRGGARIYQWYPVEPSQQDLDRVMTTLTSHLEEQGCLFES